MKCEYDWGGYTPDDVAALKALIERGAKLVLLKNNDDGIPKVPRLGDSFVSSPVDLEAVKLELEAGWPLGLQPASVGLWCLDLDIDDGSADDLLKGAFEIETISGGSQYLFKSPPFGTPGMSGRAVDGGNRVIGKMIWGGSVFNPDDMVPMGSQQVVLWSGGPEAWLNAIECGDLVMPSKNLRYRSAPSADDLTVDNSVKRWSLRGKWTEVLGMWCDENGVRQPVLKLAGLTCHCPLCGIVGKGTRFTVRPDPARSLGVEVSCRVCKQPGVDENKWLAKVFRELAPEKLKEAVVGADYDNDEVKSIRDFVLADRFIEKSIQSSRALFSNLTDTWYVCHDDHGYDWTEDRGGAYVMKKVLEYVRYSGEGVTGGNYRGVLTLLRSYLLDNPVWNSDPALLGVPMPRGGVYDLNTGIHRMTKRNDFVNRRIGVNPAKGEIDLWNSFLDRMFGGGYCDVCAEDPFHGGECDCGGEGAYLMRFLAYSLTAYNTAGKAVYLYGGTRGGKSTLINVVSRMFGSYCEHMDRDLLYSSSNSKFPQHPAGLAKIMGSRLAIGTEVPKVAYLNDDLFKSLTGTDRVTARFMRENFKTWDSETKLLLPGNHLPRFDTDDDAMLERIVPLRVTTVPENERDENLVYKLHAISPFIMERLIQLAARGLADGFALMDVPESARRNLKKEVSERDDLGGAISELFVESKGDVMFFREVRELVAEHVGYVPHGKKLAGRMRKAGYESEGTSQNRRWLDIANRTNADNPLDMG